LVQNCNTKPNDESGQFQGGVDCITRTCASEDSNLLGYPACLDCLLYNITTSTPYSTSKTNCTADTRYPLGYGGASTSILASRYPFAKKSDGTDDIDVYFLPSTGFRRAMLGARVQPDPTNPQITIDVYCGFNSSPLIASELTYVGNYSKASTYPDEKGNGQNGWRDEQNFQIKRMIDHLKTRSGTSPAILMGDWHASIAQPPGGPTYTIGNQSPEALGQLEGAFIPAHANGGIFNCTYCASSNTSGPPNPYTPPFPAQGVQGYDYITTYLSGTAFTAASTTEEQIKFTEDVVSYDPLDATKKGPLSEYYGRRVRVLRPQ
jgi:hypothetical protein